METTEVTPVGTANEATRNLWVKRALKQIPANSRLLDAGAGEHPYKPFCSHLRYVSQDFARYDGQGDSRGLQTGRFDYRGLDIVCDVTAIPEADGSFDTILCTEVLEHLPNPLQAIEEFARLLRSGGQLIVTAPFCSLTHFAPYHYYTGFSRYFYRHHLPAHGLDVVELEPNGNYFEYLAQELRRVPSVAGRYAADRPRRLELFALRGVLAILERLSKKGTASAELLSFGYHVRAVKR